MDELLLKYDKLIYMMANKYKNYASIDDLYQAGCIGLKEALTHYDKSKGSDLTSKRGKRLFNSRVWKRSNYLWGSILYEWKYRKDRDGW